jgi:hypothetical protein
LTVSTIKFGTDGWRGVIAEDFTFANVRKVACAIARYVVRAEKPGEGVLVGYDTRFGSERLARAAAEPVSGRSLVVHRRCSSVCAAKRWTGVTHVFVEHVDQPVERGNSLQLDILQVPRLNRR